MNKALSIFSIWLWAGSLAGAAPTALQAVDGGGARAGSANYTADQSVGGIVGISTVTAPVETAKHGYIGQLTDLAGFAVQPETNAVDEGGSQNLNGVATLDDDSALAVSGSNVSWSAAVFPLFELTAAGLATADNVYEDRTASVTGAYIGVSGTGSFLVRNTGTDDFDTYAGDGLPDDWQVDHFGVGNPEGGPTNNVDGDPFDNTGEWIADTLPTDDTSYFQLTAVSNVLPDDVSVAFESSSARRYSLEVQADTMTSGWAVVAGQTNLPGADGERWLTDSNAPVSGYYRVTVAVP
jgi:hypothetical protein